MEFPNPIPPRRRHHANAKIVSIEAKTTGETMTVRAQRANPERSAVQKTLFIIFYSRRSKPRRCFVRTAPAEPDRGEPLFSVAQTIDKNSNLSANAEASGDPNPIHVDKTSPRWPGLPGIIVHGLCTMAFRPKIAIDKLCSGDPTRLKRLRVRFSRSGAGPARPSPQILGGPTKSDRRTAAKVFRLETSIPTANPSSRAASRSSHPDFGENPPIGLSLSLTGEYAPMGRQPNSPIHLSSPTPTPAARFEVGGERASSRFECHYGRERFPSDAPKSIARCAPIAART